MKPIRQYTLLIFAFLLLSSFKIPNEDEQAKKDALLTLVMQNVQRKHYQSTTINDDFSKKVFSKYLETLDRNKRLFLASDIKTLKRFEEQLDEEIEQRTRVFFELSLVILKKRLETIEK